MSDDDAIAMRATMYHELRYARAEAEAARRMLAWRGLSGLQRYLWETDRLRAEGRERDLIERLREQHAA